MLSGHAVRIAPNSPPDGHGNARAGDEGGTDVLLRLQLGLGREQLSSVSIC